MPTELPTSRSVCAPCFFRSCRMCSARPAPRIRSKSLDEFEALGLTLKTFYVGNLKPSDKSAEELRAMGMLDMATYTQLQAADAMRDAASNPSGGAGLTAGIGAGVGIGNLMGEALKG